MKNINNIVCDNCSAQLIGHNNESDGTISSRLIQAGFIVKNPILLTGKSQWLHFCQSSCCTDFYYEKLNIDAARRKEVNELINEVRKEIPEVSKKISSKVLQMKTYLTSIRK